jgi:hypothetical protein
MAGSLVLIQEVECAGVSTATLTGIDSTYDVYVCQFNNVKTGTDSKNIGLQVTVSGSADTTANYDSAFKFFRTDTTFSNVNAENGTSVTVTASAGNDAGLGSNGSIYLFNFNNSSEYSFATVEQVYMNLDPTLMGYQGGFVHTVAQSCDGIKFTNESSANWDSGTFKLYGLVK